MFQLYNFFYQSIPNLTKLSPNCFRNYIRIKLKKNPNSIKTVGSQILLHTLNLHHMRLSVIITYDEIASGLFSRHDNKHAISDPLWMPIAKHMIDIVSGYVRLYLTIRKAVHVGSLDRSCIWWAFISCTSLVIFRSHLS